MAYLVRKISRAKWPEAKCPKEDIFGDAISDIRTYGNTLSTWEIESLDDLDVAALALAASSKTEKIENVCVVWISESDIMDNSILIDDSKPGDTVISDLSRKHRDLYGMTYKTIGTVAQIINMQILDDNYKRYTKADIKKMLVDALRAGRISNDKCSHGLLEEIKTAAS